MPSVKCFTQKPTYKSLFESIFWISQHKFFSQITSSEKSVILLKFLIRRRQILLAACLQYRIILRNNAILCNWQRVRFFSVLNSNAFNNGKTLYLIKFWSWFMKFVIPLLRSCNTFLQKSEICKNNLCRLH